MDALGERGREQDVGRATFECAAEDRPLGADGIQDLRQIRDAGLEVGGVDIAFEAPVPRRCRGAKLRSCARPADSQRAAKTSQGL